MTQINAEDILKPFRTEIDSLDNDIVALIGERFRIVKLVGEAKALHALSPVQPKRMDEVLDRVADLAKQNDLDPQFIRNLYAMMIDHAHTLEFDITGDQQEAEE